MANVLIVSSAASSGIAELLKNAGHDVTIVSGPVDASARIAEVQAEIMVVDADAPCPEKWIVDGASEYALYFLDSGGIVRTWNAGAQRIHGFTAAEIIGKHVSVLYTEADRQARVPEAELDAAVANGSANDARWMVRKGGAAFWSEGVMTTVHNAGGEVAGFSRVSRDASERRRLEQALERSNEELQRFAFTVSHDLKEPIRTVKSYAELLSRKYKGRLDTDAEEFMKFMVDGADRMAQLVNDLLSYSQAGREDRTRPEPTQSANVLQWALMNVDKLAKETGTVITHGPLPTLHADQAQLAQVFQNLIGNAIKFRSPEEPRIHICADRTDDSFWQISVKDNGIGVAPEFHERIFGVFKRLHGRDVPGTGIGLAICRKIVEAHGGRIWIESAAGQGSTVKFTWPGDE